MAQAVWPAPLPQRLLRDGFRQALPSNVIREKMEVGPDKLRKQTSSKYQTIEGSIGVTQEQLKTLIIFYTNTLLEGALPFTWVDPIFQTLETFRFVDPPTWEIFGLDYKIKLKLEMQVTGVMRPLRSSDLWGLGLVESTGVIV